MFFDFLYKSVSFSSDVPYDPNDQIGALYEESFQLLKKSSPNDIDLYYMGELLSPSDIISTLSFSDDQLRYPIEVYDKDCQILIKVTDNTVPESVHKEYRVVYSPQLRLDRILDTIQYLKGQKVFEIMFNNECISPDDYSKTLYQLRITPKAPLHVIILLPISYIYPFLFHGKQYDLSLWRNVQCREVKQMLLPLISQDFEGCVDAEEIHIHHGEGFYYNTDMIVSNNYGFLHPFIVSYGNESILNTYDDIGKQH